MNKMFKKLPEAHKCIEVICYVGHKATASYIVLQI